MSVSISDVTISTAAGYYQRETEPMRLRTHPKTPLEVI
jgi:hypothetical protein